jgi:predicted amidohydrolase YtcJ
MQPRNLLFRQAGLQSGRLRDIRISDGIIQTISTDLPQREGDHVIEANGNALLCGLSDHHLHLFAAATALQSVACGPPAVSNEDELRRALSLGIPCADGWLRGIGFHESVCATLDRQWLDRTCPQHPVRIQHRSGMLWVLNSRALAELDLSEIAEPPPGAERDDMGRLTGRFFDSDAWLGNRIGVRRPSVATLSARLASFGVTGVTDAGARNGPAAWHALREAKQRGELRQRLTVMGDETLGEVAEQSVDGIDLGALKIYLRESGLPELQELVTRFAAAHEQGRRVAVHCVSRTEIAVALAAFEASGVLNGDRIEHAAVCDDAAVERISELGLYVITQPHFIAERGAQYLEQVNSDDVPFLYRAAAFRRYGARLAAGSDAPYGGLDPWAAMRAATSRRTGKGDVIAADEALSPLEALALYSGDLMHPASASIDPTVGTAADLCLLDVPWEHALRDLDSKHVAMTVCDGHIIHSRVMHS